MAVTAAAAVAGPTAFGSTNDEEEELVFRIRDAYADGQLGVHSVINPVMESNERFQL